MARVIVRAVRLEIGGSCGACLLRLLEGQHQRGGEQPGDDIADLAQDPDGVVQLGHRHEIDGKEADGT